MHYLEMEIHTFCFNIPCSTPQYALNWIYYCTKSGQKFSHNCDLAHKYSEKMIVQRSEELQKVLTIGFFTSHIDFAVDFTAG